MLLHPLIPFAPPEQAGLAGRRVLITAGRRDPICRLPLIDFCPRQNAKVTLLLHDSGHEIRPAKLDALSTAFRE